MIETEKKGVLESKDSAVFLWLMFRVEVSLSMSPSGPKSDAFEIQTPLY